VWDSEKRVEKGGGEGSKVTSNHLYIYVYMYVYSCM